MQDLRCEAKLHGILIRDGVVEVKCDSRFCGARRGVVVVHHFSTVTGELLGTKRYKDTPEVRQTRRKAG